LEGAPQVEAACERSPCGQSGQGRQSELAQDVVSHNFIDLDSAMQVRKFSANRGGTTEQFRNHMSHGRSTYKAKRPMVLMLYEARGSYRVYRSSQERMACLRCGCGCGSGSSESRGFMSMIPAAMRMRRSLGPRVWGSQESANQHDDT
jgi:hypothetical protein